MDFIKIKGKRIGCIRKVQIIITLSSIASTQELITRSLTCGGKRAGGSAAVVGD
jgi:hypothetical protein